jgi:hypothetical protein
MDSVDHHKAFTRILTPLPRQPDSDVKSSGTWQRGFYRIQSTPAVQFLQLPTGYRNIVTARSVIQISAQVVAILEKL